MKIIGILVVFSEINREHVENEFRMFMNSTCRDNTIIIVNNGNSLRKGDIRGSNKYSEFSAWNEGLATINIEDFDIFIFANDTFCVRKKWGLRIRRRFLHAINLMTCVNSPAFAGEVNTFGEYYKILTDESNVWVRTNFFILNRSALNALVTIGLDRNLLGEIIWLNESGQLQWSDAISPNLRDRITSWLYPRSGQFGWYKSRDADSNLKLRKALAIINEKYMAARALSQKVEIIDCGPSWAEKICNRVVVRIQQLVFKN